MACIRSVVRSLGIEAKRRRQDDDPADKMSSLHGEPNVATKGIRMRRWIKPGISGAVIGSILTMIVGFQWGGWTTSATATEGANAAVTAALIPVCVAQSKTDRASARKLAQLRTISASWEQQDFVTRAGWASIPGIPGPSPELVDGCTSALLKTAAN
jgi:dienelactone hydrolase